MFNIIRILSLNGRSLEGMKLPELQSCMYQEDGETTFTVEYDVGKQVKFRGAIFKVSK